MYILAISNYTSNLNKTIDDTDIDSNFGPLWGFLLYVWCLTFVLIYVIYKLDKLPNYIKSKCV